MRLKTRLLSFAALAVVAAAAPAAVQAQETAQQARTLVKLDIPAGPAHASLNAVADQAGVQLFYPYSFVAGRSVDAIRGEFTRDEAIRQIAAATGLQIAADDGRTVTLEAPQSESAAGDGADGTVEALIVTAQKREEDIQDVPIAISAFTQEALERSQVAGGPDLMTQVPNMTFTKTNFSSYSIQIRGIGTQAISATTDAAVAVAFNNSSMIRNRFFEQEFYDLQRIEVLRGPQGTLYGRNATAGVVNIISAKPTFRYEAKLSADVANYGSTRLEGMLNLPLADDVVALRVAGAWTRRDGYVTNELTGDQIDGRDLWSTRVSLRIDPTERLSANLIWEHFEENDARLRSGKQLCNKHTPLEIAGVPVVQDGGTAGSEAATYSQGCLPSSMYSPDAFQTPNGFALPYYAPLGQIGLPVFSGTDPYVSATQSRDLRVIESTLTPEYDANSDLLELQVSVDVSPELTIASETAYSTDELFSFQDFNRFNTKPGVFDYNFLAIGNSDTRALSPEGVFCDPQLGCADRLVLGDLSTAKSRQFSQEVRLSSDFQGAFNFSLGANFLRYDTEDKYYVFANSLSLWAASQGEGGPGNHSGFTPYVPGVTDNGNCLNSRRPGNPEQAQGVLGCIPIDPNPIHSLDDTGHNYFLSRNPYKLISYAVFGEAYYNITGAVKLTTGLRWTVDKKEAPVIPSWLIAAEDLGRPAFGHPVTEVVRQEWREPTGRVTLDWKPSLDFTDETLVYGSYARGYKAGGMNPPPAVIALYTNEYSTELNKAIVQPDAFDSETVQAFEVGSKNRLLNGALTLNVGAFYYDYKDYQLSQILNRSAVTQNFDAKIWGLELEADWRPLENLTLGLKAGYENTRVADGERAIDLMDRTAGHADWVVARPFPTVPSNCILPVDLVTYGDRINVPWGGGGAVGPCVNAYILGLDPVTQQPYTPDPDVSFLQDAALWEGYPGFNPLTAPNNGAGFDKELGGNELPNAPHFTGTMTADYTLPLPNDWLATLHTDIYYQSEAWTRIFNMEGYDKLKAYTNMNLAAIFTNDQAGWKVMAYVKNVFDRDSITGAFLNSDDTGLTTNVFLTEPRLYGLRVTKEWSGGPWWTGANPDHVGPYPLRIELGGSVMRVDAPNRSLSLDFLENFTGVLDPRPGQHRDLDWGDGREIKVTYAPEGPWSLMAAARFGRTNGRANILEEELVVWEPFPDYTKNKYNYVLSSTERNEDHTLVDFAVGREVGLGALGGASTVSFGLRYADFESSTRTEIGGTPDYVVPSIQGSLFPLQRTEYVTAFEARRDFKGAGPVLTWDASKTLWGGDDGHLDLDASLSAGVLFGKQKAVISGGGYTDFKYATNYGPAHDVNDLPAVSSARSKSVTAPVLGAGLGLSYAINRVTVSSGYRRERYFDVVDGGYLQRDAQDRTIGGPYFKLSVGFGG